MTEEECYKISLSNRKNVIDCIKPTIIAAQRTKISKDTLRKQNILRQLESRERTKAKYADPEYAIKHGTMLGEQKRKRLNELKKDNNEDEKPEKISKDKQSDKTIVVKINEE